MKESSKSILKENKIYNDYLPNSEILVNKPNVFFNKYKLNNTNVNNFPANITRDFSGAIILDEIPFIKENYPDTDLFWIVLDNGSRILIKYTSEDKIEQEILIMYLLKALRIKCAKYDKVKLNGKNYLASLSFLAPNEKIVTNREILSIDEGFNASKKTNSELHYLKTIFADRLYGNRDRFPNNYGIIHSYNNPDKICPLFDNGDFCFSEISDSRFPKINGKNDLDVVMNYLLSNNEIMNWVENIMTNVNLDKLYMQLEENKIKLSGTTYDNFKFYFKDVENIINDELKSKNESFRIKIS